MQEIWKSINKHYFFNAIMIFGVIFSIIIMFVIQFKYDGMQDSINLTKSQISDQEDEIRLLEVEWVYLNQPDRLRKISAEFLKENGYALANQIMDENYINTIEYANYVDNNDNKNIKSQTDI